MIIFASAWISSILADLLTVATILSMVWLGARFGLFLSTIAGLLSLTGFVAALSLAPAGARWLEAADCPAGSSRPLAYFLIFAAVTIGGRLMVGAAVREDDLRLAHLPDQILGGAVGLASGVLVGGAILFGWSMCELPRMVHLDPQQAQWRIGEKALWVFVRCVEPHRDKREFLYGGDVAGQKAKDGALRASEPFADEDEDGLYDDNERYIDDDGNGVFSQDVPYIDASIGQPGVRDLGLLHGFLLSSKRMRVNHRPRFLEAAPTANIPADADADGPIFTAVAEDPDLGDQLTFSLKPDQNDDARHVVIDPQTGAVTIPDSGLDPTILGLSFCVVVSDRSGMTAEKQVMVDIKRPARK